MVNERFSLYMCMAASVIWGMPLLLISTCVQAVSNCSLHFRQEHLSYISQNDSGDLRGVAGGDGELGCLCGKASTGHLCDGSAHSSGCVVNGYGCLLYVYISYT